MTRLFYLLSSIIIIIVIHYVFGTLLRDLLALILVDSMKLGILLLIIIFLVVDYLFDITCEQPKIAGLPSIPAALPILGSLMDLGCSQSLTYLSWSRLLNAPVFQVRLGCKRFIVANSYQAVKCLWVNNMSANCSRPVFYTFHKVVSSSQGYTIGTTPWSDTYKRKRNIAGSALNKPAVRSYMSIIDRESAYCIQCIIDCINDLPVSRDIDIRPFFNTYALNTVIDSISPSD